MKRIISALAMMTAAAVGIAGCGSDDDDDSSNAAAGKASTGGEPGNNGGAPSGNVMCEPSEDGVCQNATDCPAVASGDARIAAGTCGQGECLGAGDNSCAITCIQKAVDMTDECADCYASAVACAALKCFQQCINGPEADVCKECQVTEGCREAFSTCSGLPE